MGVLPGSPNRYRFLSHWRLPAEADAVYAALADADSYPTWWPQVRATRRIDEASGEVRCRSVLPYDLVFLVRREIEDPAARVLRATLSGDLNGTSQWTVQPTAEGSVATFDEDVVVGTGLLRVAGRFARPALTLNHRLMMHAGERGLRRHLAESVAEVPER